MAGVTLTAPAKINLRLLVGPRRDDGYHPLRSLMVALDAPRDRVRVETAPARAVTCDGIDGAANLAWTALDALEREVGRPLPLRVEIDKAIPAQAGLGGGSSDAAAVLVAADELLGLGLGPSRLERVAARVGSDVPFFVRGGAQWAQGRGEDLTPARAPRFAALLTMPDAGLSTAAVYDRFDRDPPPPPAGGDDAPPAMPDLAGWLRNDLWPAARALAPGLAEREAALRAAGAPAVLLCGSGACLAGIFADREAAEAAAERLDAPGFRAVATPAAARA
ncbi:MAG TPA: 4-(cytidine 5'-diphospho)-2-C-methyl-D-erythritol kinase [Miltoncostaeaceae bacterium]|nr:4-(cytidine 5'-diphospho)-2-C-methyl-D-erythritol kinase [Miltoncostaeaceae bacterium]